jgi:O-antigen/teichoic acid export membrane protein
MKELIRGIKVNFIGNFLRFTRAISMFIAAWLYGSENFGIYTIAWATAEILIKFGSLGLEQGLLFELPYLHSAKEEDKFYQKIASSLQITLPFSLLISLCLVVYARHFVQISLIRYNLYLLAPLVPIFLITTILISCTMSLKEMKYKVYLRDMIEPLLLLSSLFIFSWFKPLKPYGILLSHCVSFSITFVFAIFFFCKFFSLKKLFHHLLIIKEYYSLIRYSLPNYLVESFDVILYRLDIYLITGFMGTGSTEQQKLLGVYGLAKQITRTLTFTKNAFGSIFVSVTSEFFLQKNHEESWKSTRYATEKLLLLNMALFLSFLCFGRELLFIFGKDGNLVNQATFFWLLIGQFLYSSSALLMFYLIITLTARRFLTYYCLLILLTPVIGIYAVKNYGILGAAFTSGISYAAVTTLVLVEMLRNHQDFFLTRYSFRILAGGVLSGLVILFFKNFVLPHWNLNLQTNIILSMLIGFLIYFSSALKRSHWKALVKWAWLEKKYAARG